MNKLIPFLFVIFFSGCSALKEAGYSMMEVPTLEKQANRVAIGMTIVRENNIMAQKMPISADATWPKKITAPLTKKEKMMIKKILLSDPYFATVNYTEMLQRQRLGSGSLMNQFGDMGQMAAIMLNQTITPLMYRAFYKIVVFYGPDPKNWPKIFDFDATKGNFESFKNGKLKLVEATSSEVYDNISDALIALLPLNLQKDITNAKEELSNSFDEVLTLKQELADIETQLKEDSARDIAKKEKISLDIEGLSKIYKPLTYIQKQELLERKSVLKEQISQAEAIVDEKQKIYFTLLDQALVALQQDIQLDDKEYVALAQNINLVANDIQTSSKEAYTLFSIAATKILSDGIIQNFPKELETLIVAKMMVPLQLQDKYNERLKRLVKNTLYILPNIFMGSYYAHKQSVIAEKYVELTDVILEAYNTKLNQEAAYVAQQKQEGLQ